MDAVLEEIRNRYCDLFMKAKRGDCGSFNEIDREALYHDLHVIADQLIAIRQILQQTHTSAGADPVIVEWDKLDEIRAVPTVEWDKLKERGNQVRDDLTKQVIVDHPWRPRGGYVLPERGKNGG